ncbi:hypothetical protein KF7_1119 [Lactococcus lactis subsp. lactis]|nr:hypothetical protein KF7_1119 [Lactococcus lactis subsp. lactis]
MSPFPAGFFVYLINLKYNDIRNAIPNNILKVAVPTLIGLLGFPIA